MTANHHELDAVDRHLLDIVQTDFPITPRPYVALGEQVGIGEAEAFARIQTLRNAGIIRRIGANFQASRLGWVTTLCAARVPVDRVDSFAALVNALPGVTHNYVRSHDYNVWFTLISPSKAHEIATLDEIRRKTGVEILNLPAQRLYKVLVDLPMREMP